MNLKKTALAILCATALYGGAHAATITQEFDSSWTIAPWDYYGDVAAMQWHYLPYTPFDSALGTLTNVTISTTLSGSRDNPGDSVAIRTSFFTGWSPNQYQFYDAYTIAGGTPTFSMTRTAASGTDFALDNFVHYQYLPQANYYFESRSQQTHSIDARTTLTYEYTAAAVPEPQQWQTLAAGMSLMLILGGISRRRQQPPFA